VTIYSGHVDDEVVANAALLDAACFGKPIDADIAYTWIADSVAHRQHGTTRLAKQIVIMAKRHALTATETEILHKSVLGYSRDDLVEGRTIGSVRSTFSASCGRLEPARWTSSCSRSSSPPATSTPRVEARRGPRGRRAARHRPARAAHAASQ